MASDSEGTLPTVDSKSAPADADAAHLYRVHAASDFAAKHEGTGVMVRFSLSGMRFGVPFTVAEARELSDFLLRAWAAADRGSELEAAAGLFPGITSEPSAGGDFPHVEAFGCAPVEGGRVLLAVALPSIPTADGGVCRLLLAGDGRITSGLVLRAAALAAAESQGIDPYGAPLAAPDADGEPDA